MELTSYTYEREWSLVGGSPALEELDILFVFGKREVFKESHPYESLRKLHPKSTIVGCTSGGNILGTQMTKASIVATGVKFASGHVKTSTIDFEDDQNPVEVAKSLIGGLEKEGLKHLFILSDGLYINGSVLARAANKLLPNVLVTGGLAGDDANFEQTWVIANDIPKQRRVVAVGFYGESLHISSGCYAGWDAFGVERVVTESKYNVVYEIDGKPALELYKEYLGDYAKELPASGLRFPINIRATTDETAVVRTVVGINEEDNSITFAGDVPQGVLAQLMKTNIDGLIDGSQTAAGAIVKYNEKPALGLVVSCIGRRLVLNQLVDEELEVIEESLGETISLVGFYSYGELAPFSSDKTHCELHNQTMTITALYEE